MSKKPLPTLSIVTISWNQMDDIVEYLKAMVKAKKECAFPIEMVLVDNGSLDGTPEMVEKDYPWVKLVRNEKNEGFAEGCNVGLRVATGDFLMLLNPDAHAIGDSLNKMMKFLLKHDEVGIVGCAMTHTDGLPQLSAHHDISPIGYIGTHSMFYPVFEKLQKMRHRYKIALRKKPYACDWIMGACMIVPRHVFEEVGELEKSFFIYCEDTDWCTRIRKAGYKVVHMPNISIPHSQMASVARRPEFFFRRVYRSVVHYINRNFKEPQKSRVFTMMKLDMSLRKPVYRLLSILKPAKKENYLERIKSVNQMLQIIKARDPELFDDPPPR